MSYQDRFRLHTKTYFQSTARKQVWDEDFVKKNLPGLKCLEYQPSEDLAFFSYVSCGLASLLPDQEVKHEYVISSPFQTLEHAELMCMIAAAFIDRKAFFSLGDIISIGRPWITGSKADHLLVSLPYPYGSKLELAESALPNLQVLWLLPIYSTEVDFYHAEGLEALEQKFDEGGIRFCDPKREPVV